MRAMVLRKPGTALQDCIVPDPEPGFGQVLVKIAACGVCRTDLHVVDGDLTEPKLPIIPGHEIVGRIEAVGPGVTSFWPGERVAWPHLWPVLLLPVRRREPLRCPGLHGLPDRWGICRVRGGRGRILLRSSGRLWRCGGCSALMRRTDWLSRVTDGRQCGQVGHLRIWCRSSHVAQVAQFEARSVYAFTRAGDTTAQAFARQLGCTWAGSSEEQPPTELDAAIIFAPVGSLLPVALASVRKGGVVVLGGIHMSDIPSMPYARLWGERMVRSVANLTRQDAKEFLELAARTPIQTHVEQFALGDANTALDRLRAGRLTGAAVLIP